MKMSPKEFEQLKSDFLVMVDALQKANGPFDYGNVGTMWRVYHWVMDDRSYDDSHPFYCGEKPRQRVLPFVDRRYNSKFYDAALDAPHIPPPLPPIVSIYTNVP